MLGRVKVDLNELEMAIAELKGRSNKDHINIAIDGRDVVLSVVDRSDNDMKVVLNEEGRVAAKFIYTERLAYMKDKK